jgi:uncharacterized damage-inducible protein DinB
MVIADVVRYNHAVRDLYLEALGRLPWSQVIESRGLSFDSARNVFLHLTIVEDRWVNYILPNRYGDWKDLDFDGFADIGSLKRFANATKRSTEAFLDSLKPEDFSRKVTLPWTNYNPGSQVTVETALIHMVMEDMIHYGELSAMFWQMNLEAPYMAYCRYKLGQEAAIH